MLSDDQIVKGCKNGKRHAFSALYDKYAAAMLGVCFRYTKSKMEAEDVLQEAFVKVFQKIKSFEGKGSFEGWLRRIMVNTAINYYKEKQKRRMADLDLNSKDIALGIDSQDDEPFKIEGLNQDELMNMLQQLPDGYRMVFNLYVIEGLKHDEIANELNISTNTSKTQLFKARRWLRKEIAKRQKQILSL